MEGKKKKELEWSAEREWGRDEVDINEEKLWESYEGIAVPQSVYKVTDRVEKEMREAVRNLERFGEDEEGNGSTERVKAASQATEVWEGFTLLCRIRRARVHAHRKDKREHLEEVQRQLAEAEKRLDPPHWGHKWDEEKDEGIWEKEMWGRGEAKIGREIYLEADAYTKQYARALQELEEGLREERFISRTEIEGKENEVKMYRRKMWESDELARERRGRYVNAKYDVLWAQAKGEQGEGEAKPTKRAKKGE